MLSLSSVKLKSEVIYATCQKSVKYGPDYGIDQATEVKATCRGRRWPRKKSAKQINANDLPENVVPLFSASRTEVLQAA